jgi:beta-phosphoglucomutase-like phosphatase (HAD superfamily)
MANFETVVFDLDGTIADTLPLIYEAFNAALAPKAGRRLSPPASRPRSAGDGRTPRPAPSR